MKTKLKEKDDNPLISIVVLTCPGRQKELWHCLSSITKSNYKKFETIVVGNGCDPDLAKAIRLQFPKTKTIFLPTNSGCFGFNVGYINAKGKYILSLDDDTSIKPNTLKKIINTFEKQPKDVGILSINSYNPKTKHYYLASTDGFTGFQAGGAVFRKELFNQIGYFDEDFFLWGEEDDLALRALDAGYKTFFAKHIVINHYEKTGKLRKKQIFFNARNKAWLNLKHFSLIFIPLIILRDLVWILLLPYRKKSLIAIWYGLIGYVLGYLTFWIPLKKRKIITYNIQTKFIKFYLFSDIQSLIKTQ